MKRNMTLVFACRQAAGTLHRHVAAKQRTETRPYSPSLTSHFRKTLMSVLLVLFSIPFSSAFLFAVTPLSFRMVGAPHAICATTPYEYGISWNAAPALVITAAHQWRWQVVGGRFQDGKTEHFQGGTVVPSVQVFWQSHSTHEGKISLELLLNGKPVNATTTTIYLGLLAPTAIQIEEGILSCEGNWFVLKLEVPLSGDETVEWTVANGLDIYGKPISFVSQKGMDADRLYIEKSDQNLPLTVSVRLRSDCDTYPKATKTILQEFDYPKTRLNGSERLEQGRQLLSTFALSRPTKGPRFGIPPAQSHSRASHPFPCNSPTRGYIPSA